MRRPVDAARLDEFLAAFGRESPTEVRVYLTGGATAVLHGWRLSKIDVDLKIVPDSDQILQSLPRLKESLQILCAPAEP